MQGFAFKEEDKAFKVDFSRRTPLKDSAPVLLMAESAPVLLMAESAPVLLMAESVPPSSSSTSETVKNPEKESKQQSARADVDVKNPVLESSGYGGVVVAGLVEADSDAHKEAAKVHDRHKSGASGSDGVVAAGPVEVSKDAYKEVAKVHDDHVEHSDVDAPLSNARILQQADDNVSGKNNAGTEVNGDDDGNDESYEADWIPDCNSNCNSICNDGKEKKACQDEAGVPNALRIRNGRKLDEPESNESTDTQIQSSAVTERITHEKLTIDTHMSIGKTTRLSEVTGTVNYEVHTTGQNDSGQINDDQDVPSGGGAPRSLSFTLKHQPSPVRPPAASLHQAKIVLRITE